MGTQLLSLLDGLFSVLCFSAYLKVCFAFEHFAERVTDQPIVIHDQDGLRHRQHRQACQSIFGSEIFGQSHTAPRSEERRVGKEWKCLWGQYYYKKIDERQLT